MTALETARVRPWLAPVLAIYGAQGMSYAVVVTALPSLKERIGLSDGVVAGLLLGVCFTAALGSLLADAVAVRKGSRWAVATGFAIQAAALVGAAFSTQVPAFAVAMAVYGVGLGAVDAANNMQGALIQSRSARPVFGRLYAGYTAAGIAGALITSGANAAGVISIGTLLFAAAVAVAMVVVGLRWCDPTTEVRSVTARGEARVSLPMRSIWAVGAFVLAAFVVDSAVATWSTVYLADGLTTSASVAPLGYAAYLAVVLVTRLAADPLAVRLGAPATAAVGIGLAAVGCFVVVVVGTPAGAIAGFAAAGAAAGLIVPVAFGRAGALSPERRDEVMARVNLFNYGGALIGAVALGALASDSSMLAIGFVLPAVAVLAVIPLRKALRGASPNLVPEPPAQIVSTVPPTVAH